MKGAPILIPDHDGGFGEGEREPSSEAEDWGFGEESLWRVSRGLAHLGVGATRLELGATNPEHWEIRDGLAYECWKCCGNANGVDRGVHCCCSGVCGVGGVE